VSAENSWKFGLYASANHQQMIVESNDDNNDDDKNYTPRLFDY
jgi:hypothetical protein